MAKVEEFTLKIPVGDWMKEYAQIEPDVSSEDKIIELMTKEKMGTAQVGRLVIIAREAGQASDDIIPGNKPLLNTGAAMAIQSIMTQRYREATLPSGNTIRVREFVAPVGKEGGEESEPSEDGDKGSEDPPITDTLLDDDKGFAGVYSETAQRRAIDYLHKVVPGYIYGRLKIIAVNGGSLDEVTRELKGQIDEMVSRLR